VADEGLVEMIRFDLPEGLRRAFLRTVARIEEEGRVAGAGVAEVLSKAVDERLPRGVSVQQQPGAQAAGEVGVEKRSDRPRVIHAAGQAMSRVRIVVNPDDQGV
jgi:hypothetical protein